MPEPRNANNGTSSLSNPPPPTLFSVGTKLAVATASVVLVVSGFLYGELTRRERTSLLHAKETAATMVADLFAATLSAPLDFDDADAIRAELENLKTNPEIACAAVWVGTAKEPSAVVARGCDATRAVTVLDTAAVAVFDDRVEVARFVRGRADATVGSVRVVFSLARENAAFAASRSRIFWLTFLLAALTTLALVGITRFQVVKPLESLARASRRIGRGDFTAGVEVRSKDEVGHLAHAMNRMREAIADRERRLAAATQNLRDLFDHMRQAIVAFDRSGAVRGDVSRQAKRLFGADAEEGHRVLPLLYPGAPAHDVDVLAFDEWVQAAFDVPAEAWTEFADLAPKEVVVPGGDGGTTVPLELEFRPVTKDGAVDRVMLLATDVSEKKRLEEAVVTAEEEHARRTNAMRKLVAGGAQIFVDFLEAADDHVRTAHEVLGPFPRPLPAADVDLLFRRVHTMKGEARAFDLRELEAEAAAAEEILEDRRRDARQAPSSGTRSRSHVMVSMVAAHGALLACLERATARVAEARALFVAASPIGEAALDVVTVRRSDVRALETTERSSPPGALPAEVRSALRRLSARPFGESATTLGERAPAWAEREGKRVVFDVAGKDVRVPSDLSRVLGGVLTHLVRNAIAHGIETPEERIACGKEAHGTVQVSAYVTGEAGTSDRPVLVVEDDGRGLDDDAILARAKVLGLRGEDPRELVFQAGLSTAETVDDLAGRGVGLDAVHADLASVGYVVAVVSEKGQGTRFVMTPRAP
ncbi:MAG: HAMP domain-containing protein [Polyangiaceae bacterium]